MKMMTKTTTNLTNLHQSGFVRIGAIRGFLCALCVSVFICSAPAATVVDNGGGTGLVSATGGIVGWGVSSTNSTNPVVIVWYGQSDGGSNAAWWSASTNLGAKAIGTNTVTLTNLTSGRMYYYRASGYEGTNATNWATTSPSFWTIAGVPTNLPATQVRAVMVDTNGHLASPMDLGLGVTNVVWVWRQWATNSISYPDAFTPDTLVWNSASNGYWGTANGLSWSGSNWTWNFKTGGAWTEGGTEETNRWPPLTFISASTNFEWAATEDILYRLTDLQVSNLVAIANGSPSTNTWTGDATTNTVITRGGVIQSWTVEP